MRLAFARPLLSAVLLALLLLGSDGGVGRLHRVGSPILSVSALMYPVTNRARPCFIEEVEPHTSYITGAYVWHKHDANAKTHLRLELRTPSQALLDSMDLVPEDSTTGIDDTTENFQSSMVKAVGRPISFRLLEGQEKELGPYQLCLEVTPPISGLDPNRPIFLSIDIDQAATREIRNKQKEAEELKELLGGTGEPDREKAKVSYLQKTGKKILDLRRETERVASNMEYFLARMDRMQQTGESTFTRVWVMSLITIIVVCSVVYAQFKWISTTIVKKKLI